MTKEEIRLAAIDCLNENMVWKPYSYYEDAILTGFYDGVDWAQKQMQESNEGKALLYAVEKTAEGTREETLLEVLNWIEGMYDTDYVAGDIVRMLKDKLKKLNNDPS